MAAPSFEGPKSSIILFCLHGSASLSISHTLRPKDVSCSRSAPARSSKRRMRWLPGPMGKRPFRRIVGTRTVQKFCIAFLLPILVGARVVFFFFLRGGYLEKFGQTQVNLRKSSGQLTNFSEKYVLDTNRMVQRCAKDSGAVLWCLVLSRCLTWCLGWDLVPVCCWGCILQSKAK